MTPLTPEQKAEILSQAKQYAIKKQQSIGLDQKMCITLEQLEEMLKAPKEAQ